MTIRYFCDIIYKRASVYVTLYAHTKALCKTILKKLQEYFAIRRRCSPRRVCETQISKNTQAYFGDRRMLRTGFVFDEPLRTSTYSIKFHTQAYRSGHNEAVLKTVCLTGTGVRIPQPAPTKMVYSLRVDLFLLPQSEALESALRANTRGEGFAFEP